MIDWAHSHWNASGALLQAHGVQHWLQPLGRYPQECYSTSATSNTSSIPIFPAIPPAPAIPEELLWLRGRVEEVLWKT